MRKLGKTTGEILWDLDASAGPKVSANQEYSWQTEFGNKVNRA